MGLIFDLDQTIVDTRIADQFRKSGDWQRVYGLIPTFKVYDGILDVMEYGKQNGLKICIVTSSPSTYCKRVITHWGVPYHYTVCYHDTRNKKPHPEPILKALTLLGVDGEGALSFGDRAIDIQASKASNVKSIGCLWGSVEEKEIRQLNPEFLVTKPKELIPIIKSHFGLKSDGYVAIEPF